MTGHRDTGERGVPTQIPAQNGGIGVGFGDCNQRRKVKAEGDGGGIAQIARDEVGGGTGSRDRREEAFRCDRGTQTGAQALAEALANDGPVAQILGGVVLETIRTRPAVASLRTALARARKAAARSARSRSGRMARKRPPPEEPSSSGGNCREASRARGSTSPSRLSQVRRASNARLSRSAGAVSRKSSVPTRRPCTRICADIARPFVRLSRGERVRRF
jgi:hypothetical protein